MDYAIAVKYRLGWVGEPLPGDERFTGRLAIPYLSPAGVTSVKFRAIGDGGAKYLYHHGTKHRLYNTGAYFDADDTLGITEGEMDAIAATEHVGIPSLSVPGTGSFNDLWLALFKDFLTVPIFADGDQAGRDFANGLAEKIGWRARVIECPDGEDVSSMCASGRVGELHKLMATGGEDE